MTPWKSQVLGIALALLTAIGCIAYEKIVHRFSFFLLLMIKFFEYAVLFTGLSLFRSTPAQDWMDFKQEPMLWVWTVVYILTAATALLWFTITKAQSVMVGSIYEVKYIVMLSLIYILFGDNRFTWNTAIGVGFAICSIYFISRS